MKDGAWAAVIICRSCYISFDREFRWVGLKVMGNLTLDNVSVCLSSITYINLTCVGNKKTFALLLHDSRP